MFNPAFANWYDPEAFFNVLIIPITKYTYYLWNAKKRDNGKYIYQTWFYSVALITSQTRASHCSWVSVFWLINKWCWATGMALTCGTYQNHLGASSTTNIAVYHNGEDVFWMNLSAASNILPYIKLRTLKLKKSIRSFSVMKKIYSSIYNFRR